MKTPRALWTALEIASVTGGALAGEDFDVTGISIDTRTLQPGDLFIALNGPNFDGHDFVADALSRQASGILVSRDCGSDKQILVPDTFTALNDLGAGARARSQARIFAVTGSVGKTTTKEILSACLKNFGQTHAASASLNNHWGVPLSLARMPQEANYAVFELGMNHAGEIAPLSKLVSPHIALITTIASAHIQHLGSLENIAHAKAEIFQGMDAAGVAVLPRDSEQFPILLAEARTQGIQTIKTFGLHPEADARLIDIRVDNDMSEIEAIIDGEILTFSFGIPGAHHGLNVLSSLTALSAAGLSITKILPHLADIKPVIGRGNRFSLTLVPGQAPVTVIDETHNASPVAVEAALYLLAQIPAKGRRVALLGDMLELGQNAETFHAGLKKTIDETGVDMTLTCGRLMAYLAEKLPLAKNRHFPDSKALAAYIGEFVQPGDTLLIKGSRGSQMRLVVDALKEIGQIHEPEQSKILHSA